MPRFCLFFGAFLVLVVPAYSQERENFRQEPYAFVGMRLDELVSRFGPPRAVYASRGDELWKDDVVFEYREGDFYVFRDRVWQVGVQAAYNIKTGDPKPAALLVLGEGASDMGGYALFPLASGTWPLALRVNFNAGIVSAIFIYRTDF